MFLFQFEFVNNTGGNGSLSNTTFLQNNTEYVKYSSAASEYFK